MNKLLISLLSLTGIAGISTGGYFLLSNSTETVKNVESKVSEQANEEDQARSKGQSEDSGAGSKQASDS